MKTRDVFKRLAQPQLLNNVVPNALRGARRERRDRLVREQLPQAAQLAILRPEIVPPFRNTMRFVNREEGNRHALEPLRGTVQHHTLRRKIEQPEFTRDDAALQVAAFRRRGRAIQKNRRNPHLRELRHLVLHQRNKR